MKKAIQDFEIALAKKGKELEELSSPYFAECALEELIDERRHLETEIDQQRQVVNKSIQSLMEELGKLEEMQRDSVNLSFKSQPVCLALRNNPLPELGIPGLFHLQDMIRDVNEAVGRLRGR